MNATNERRNRRARERNGKRNRYLARKANPCAREPRPKQKHPSIHHLISPLHPTRGPSLRQASGSSYCAIPASASPTDVFSVHPSSSCSLLTVRSANRPRNPTATSSPSSPLTAPAAAVVPNGAAAANADAGRSRASAARNLAAPDECLMMMMEERLDPRLLLLQIGFGTRPNVQNAG